MVGRYHSIPPPGAQARLLPRLLPARKGRRLKTADLAGKGGPLREDTAEDHQDQERRRHTARILRGIRLRVLHLALFWTLVSGGLAWLPTLPLPRTTLLALQGLIWLAGCALTLLAGRRMVHDARDHLRTEQILRENEVEFRTTLNATTVGLFRLRNLHFDFVNATLAEMMGYGVEEFLTLSPMDVVVPEQRDMVRQNSIRRAEGEPGYPYQLTFLRKDGGTFIGQVWSKRILFRGKPCTVGSIVDISARIEAEQEMRRMVNALAASNLELERFAYVASHDLQEPLRAITSFSQLLERRLDGRLDAEAAEYLRFIITGGKRMHALVNDLLAFSRVAHKGSPFQLVSCDDSVAMALQTLQDSIRDSHAVITVGRLPMILADAMQIEQLFQHLIGNAIKFGQPGKVPHIRIGADREQDEYHFRIEDDGIGIPPEYHTEIFSVVRRLHKGPAYPGTGVGLAICKRVVERHQGRIWVSAMPAQGSCFHFTLPAPDGATPPC